MNNESEYTKIIDALAAELIFAKVEIDCLQKRLKSYEQPYTLKPGSKNVYVPVNKTIADAIRPFLGGNI